MTAEFGFNQGWVEELYLAYLENPRSVDSSWRAYFDAQAAASGSGKTSALPFAPAARGATDAVPPSLRGGHSKLRAAGDPSVSGRVYQLITAYRFLGHLGAHTNPLTPPPALPKELQPTTYGFAEQDLERTVTGVDLPSDAPTTVGGVVQMMGETYCRSIGVEFRNIENTTERHWLQKRMESTRNHLALKRDEQVRLLSKLSDAENLEQFIGSSYAPGTKRFSLEGGESLIPLLDMLIERGAEHGIEEIVFGMAHRGRLNVLVNTLEMRLRDIFYAFEDKDAERYLGSGDVKYHLGFSNDRKTACGREVHLTMTFNPSHLEFVNPVVEGRVRAKQDRLGENGRNRIAPLLIHGDAAFVGQGVVAETLNLTGLNGYTTGGTIHIIVNNQVGFTTNPEDSRSTRYASDILRMLNVPVFHVNGEDPEAVAQVATLAVEYRQRFHKDVLIDLYCYRRHGHNEGDEPRFTQPLMYDVIDKKPTVREMYVQQLIQMGQIDQELADSLARTRRAALETALDEAKKVSEPPEPATRGGLWSQYTGGADATCPEVTTACDRETLLTLSANITTLPDSFNPHRKIAMLLKQRHKRLSEGGPFDWGTAENLAYASLLAEGHDIRISGEDVGRGTFSHRHAVLVDQKTGGNYVPLNHIAEKQGHYESTNSPLSEAAVLGFDFGYSLDSPDKLVIWEAQFGDFLNGAQVIIDQFLTSSEDKWLRLSGLMLLLPHGYEGQGPEHSSARVERFLQNSAEDNIQVCNLTTPAQLFHCIRRQVKRSYRKPLVVFSPKSLLRAAFSVQGPRPISSLDDLCAGAFQRVICDESVDPSKARKVLLCSGKVYYDLARWRFENGIDDVAILRLEQLYPLNDDLATALAAYRDATPLVWVQEEPWNYGPWFYIHATLPQKLGQRLPLSCLSRAPSASPATGSKASHNLEQKRLVTAAFT